MKKFNLVLCAVAASLSFSSYAQTCNDAMEVSHPEGQYVLNGDGTVTDVVNGLIWTVCAIGQTYSNGSCTGTPTDYASWQDALVAADGFGTFAGSDKWRMPNIKELGDLVERSCVAPAINLTYFPGTLSAVYWSNTLDANNVNSGANGLIVDFTDGTEFLNELTSYRLVRMVRAIGE